MRWFLRGVTISTAALVLASILSLAAFVPAGGIVDHNGEINGEASPRVRR